MGSREIREDSSRAKAQRWTRRRATREKRLSGEALEDRIFLSATWDDFSNPTVLNGTGSADSFDLSSLSDMDFMDLDGLGGLDQANLGTVRIEDVTFRDGGMLIDLGSDQTARVDFASVETLTFSDGTATVLSGSYSANQFQGSQTFIEGEQVFSIAMSKGKVDWSYDASTDALSVTGVKDSGSATLSIIDVNDSDLGLPNITLTDDLKSLVTDANVGTLTIQDDNQIDSVIVSGGSGSISTLSIQDNEYTNDTTIQASIGTLDFTDKFKDHANFSVTGDVGSIDIATLEGGSTIHVGGDLGTFHGNQIDGRIEVDAALGSFTITNDDGPDVSTNFTTPTHVIYDGGSYSANAAPLANAGADQAVTEFDTVHLDASLSSDPEGDTLSYSWTQVSGSSVSLAGASSSTPSFTAPDVAGTEDLVFELAVSDGVSTTSDLVTIQVDPSAGVTASAGADQASIEGNAVTLDASGSSGSGSLSYTWTQVAGSSVTISDSSSATPTFNIPELLTDEALRFQVEVSDGTSSSVDTVDVVVAADNDAPTANAGSDQVVTEGDSVNLDASSSSDPEGQALSYGWVQTSGPSVTLSNPNAASPTFTAPEGLSNSTLVFQLSTSDGTSKDTDSVSILVQADNDAPSASAGTDQSATEGDSVTLDASASSDPEDQGLSYTWTQVAGSSVTISDSSSATPTFNIPELLTGETLRFQVEVSDGTSTSIDTVDVVVVADNDAPIFSAGEGQTVTAGDSLVLTPGSVQDPEGQTLRFHWEQSAGPLATLAGADSLQPTLLAPTVDEPSTLVFVLRIDDGAQVSTQRVEVLVVPESLDGHVEAHAQDPQRTAKASPPQTGRDPAVEGGESPSPSEQVPTRWDSAGEEVQDLLRGQSADQQLAAGPVPPAHLEHLDTSESLHPAPRSPQTELRQNARAEYDLPTTGASHPPVGSPLDIEDEVRTRDEGLGHHSADDPSTRAVFDGSVEISDAQRVEAESDRIGEQRSLLAKLWLALWSLFRTTGPGTRRS